jgi:hypothetical protein
MRKLLVVVFFSYLKKVSGTAGKSTVTILAGRDHSSICRWESHKNGLDSENRRLFLKFY